ncbi:site-specific integrase [Actinospica sp. MGRD01-02]|uniref:Site-specific integrase n=1 Tax=Actinospica acidithermotolerans TaxID=2828514 RepID=A0A941EHI6_9ACTN|nr:tyrosine-type recombinase/integrase [Actinospica acidithermotolerans]MBR7831396.1 site-specific integrase [Actinospica acidithermotolerans]
MAMSRKKLTGTVFKRCSCTREVTAPDGSVAVKAWGTRCPQLTYRDGRWSKDHGTWRFQLEVPTVDERREHLRAGFATEAECRETLDKVVALLRLAESAEDGDEDRVLRQVAGLVRAALKAKGPLPDEDELRKRLALGQQIETALTVGEYLTEWLATKSDLAEGTKMAYAMHVRVHLIPHLGKIRLDRLRVSHIKGMVDAIGAQNETRLAGQRHRAKLKTDLETAVEQGDADRARVLRERIKALGEPLPITGPASIRRIRATLSSALADAVEQLLIPVNPAKLFRLKGGGRPKGLVWTNARVAAWRKTGEKPSPVMIWTVEQTLAFLRAARGHRFAIAYHLMVLTGMRRGETAGLHWRDVDLDAGELTVTCQLAQIGWRTEITEPKTPESHRTIALDDSAVTLLRGQKAWQETQRATFGEGWEDNDLVFTNPDGTRLHPAQLTYEFYKLVRENELPPIRLHDVRHGTATHALTAGIDVKLVQDLLGHTTSSFTRDTYQGVADEARRTAATTLAAFLAQADKTLRDNAVEQTTSNHDDEVASEPEEDGLR